MTLPFSGGLLGFGSSATQGASPFHWVELGRKKITADDDSVLVGGTYRLGNSSTEPTWSKNYVARWKMKLTTVGGGNRWHEFGFSESKTAERNDNQKFQGFHLNSTTLKCLCTTSSGSTQAIGNVGSPTTLGTAFNNTTDTWYLEQKRNGDSVTFSLYPNDSYGTATYTQTLTVPSGTTANETRYFRYITNQTSNGNIGHIWDLKYWNNYIFEENYLSESSTGQKQLDESANKYGVKLASGNTLIGKTLKSITFSMKKNNSPTGNVSAKIYKNNSTSATATSTNTLDVSTLTTSFVDKTFEFASGVTLASGDRIVVEGGSHNANDQIMFEQHTTSFSDTVTIARYTSSWVDGISGDFLYKLTTTVSGDPDYTSDFSSVSADGVGLGWGATDTSKFYIDASEDKFYFDSNVSSKSTSYDLLSQNDFASKPYIQILAHNFNTGAVRSGIRFNEDGGSNYTGARSVNGSTTQSDNNGIDSIRADTDVDGSDFTIATFMNDTSMEKLGTLYRVHQSGSGATNAPDREEMAVKWANSTESIGKVESYNKETGSFTSGSECVVLGFDPDAEAGTQFWEQLKSVELSSSDGSYVGEFNGSSSYSSIGGSTTDWKFLSDGSAWTISFWFNDDNSTQNSRFFSTMNDNSGSNRGFSLTHDSTYIGIGIYDANASAGYPFSSQTSIFSDTGAWHLYTITYDGGNNASSSQAKVYKDASLIGTITQGRAMSSSAPNHTPLMGKRTDNQRYVDGKLQQFLIYKRELSASDVTALYNSGTVPTSPSTTNLYAWYKFASNMNDSGSGGNNGDNNNISISTVMPNTLDSGDFSTSISHDFGGDDITALTWTELGSSTSDASYVLENSSSDIIDIKNSGNNVAGSFGYATLPSTLSSTAWLMRFKLVLNTVTAESSGGKSFFSAIRITDSGTSGEGVGSEDGFGFWFIADAGSTQTQFRSTTNGSETYTGMSYTPASGNTIYVEISYSSGTATANFYSDSGFSSRVGSTTANATQTGTHTGLKYPQVMLRQDSGGNGVMEMELSELKIWNGSSYDISSKKYLWVQTHIPQSSNHHGYLYFNGDDGGSNNNYARRGSVNGASSDFANADDDEINWSHDTNTSKYLNLFLVNDPTKEKLGLAHYADYGGSGSGNAPNRMEFAYKWDNTSDPIKSIKLYNQYSGTTLPAGTRLIIWGAD